MGLLLLAPEVRNAGLGRALWAALEAWVRARQARVLRLAVQGQNPGARRFWNARGFVLEEELPARPEAPYLGHPLSRLRKELADFVSSGTLSGFQTSRDGAAAAKPPPPRLDHLEP